MKKSELLAVVVAMGVGACASGPATDDELEDWRYARDTARIEATEKFEKLKKHCSGSHGAVIVNRTFSRRIRKTPDDVQLATCQPGAIGAVH